MIRIHDLSLKKRIPEISHLNVQVENGEVYVLLSSGDRALRHLINIFYGLERDYKGLLEVDGEKLLGVSLAGMRPWIFLSSDPKWPADMRVGDLITFFKKSMVIPEEEFEELFIKLDLEHVGCLKISELEEVQWRRILFSLVQLKRCSNYLIHDIAKGMPLDFILEFKKHLQMLKKEGGSILYFSDDVFFAPEIADRIGFMKKGKLLLELKAEKMKRMSLKELHFEFLAEQ